MNVDSAAGENDKTNGKTPRSLKGPLTIYVAWHSKCEDGAYLANGIYEWFRAPSQSVRRSGAGIPVFYRTAMSKEISPIPYEFNAWNGGEETTPPQTPDDEPKRYVRKIGYDDAVINVVIPLIDEHMVEDADWRRWLYKLTKKKMLKEFPDPKAEGGTSDSRVLLIPVQLHGSLSRLDQAISGINAIRVDRWDDGDHDNPTQRRPRRKRRICRYLVQTMVRALRNHRSHGGQLLERSVFLSHAKGDKELGVGVAERIRAQALQHGQIDTFFDATQLAWAQPWKQAMLTGAGFRTAAFVAIFSDIYSSRYWCREEIRLARSPLAIPKEDSSEERDRCKNPENDLVWWVQPIVIVDTLESSWTQLLPEMAGTPIIRWTDGETSARDILDRVMLEALRAEVQVRHAFLIMDWIENRPIRPKLGDLEELPLHFLTWVPDAHTLMEWAFPRSDVEDFGKKRQRIERALIVYPGHGLVQNEEMLSRHNLGDEVRFASIEDLATVLRHSAPTGSRTVDLTEASNPRPTDKRPLVALSVGDPDAEELYALGYGPEHLDDAVYRITTALIGASARLAYGGVLRSTPGFLEEVLDAVGLMDQLLARHQAKKEAEEDKSEAAEEETAAEENAEKVSAARDEGITSKTPDADPETVLRSYQGWDYFKASSISQRAYYHGLCKFFDIWPEGLTKENESEIVHEREKALWRSRSLTKMRKQVAKDAQAMVALGGKIYSWSGVAPGVLEEVCYMHKEKKPVFVISAFGGASRALVHWLLCDDDQPFEYLDFDHHWEHERNPKLRQIHAAWAEEIAEEARDGNEDVDVDFNQEALTRLRQEYHGKKARKKADRKPGLQPLIQAFKKSIRQDLAADREKRLKCGLLPEELWQLMTTSSVSRIRHLLATKVVPELEPPQPKQ